MSKFLDCLKALAITILLACGIVFSGSAHASEPTFRVLASTFPVWLFTSNICADIPGVRVELLISASAGCPHDFSLKPSDLLKLSTANALVLNGAGLDDFLQETVQRHAPSLPVLDASKNIVLLKTGQHGSGINPHTFAAPEEAALMTQNIAHDLAELDKANADKYLLNGKKYTEQLAELSSRLENIGARAKNRAIVLEHEALAYLAHNAGLEIAEIFEGNLPAAALMKIERKTREVRPALIAGEFQYSDKLLKILSQDTGIPYALLDTCASGPENAPLNYYQTVMQKNIAVLEAHFDR